MSQLGMDVIWTAAIALLWIAMVWLALAFDKLAKRAERPGAKS
ncbi:hypothetical protein [Rhodoferax koreensis]|nr:hypothetical protein [Rhodoferax koreense]